MRGGSGVIQAKTSCLPRITRVLHDAPVDCPKGCPKEFHSELCSKLLAQKKRQQWVQCIRSLVALDVAVDCPHERRGCDVPDRSARQRQPDTKHERVPALVRMHRGSAVRWDETLQHFEMGCIKRTGVCEGMPVQSM
eukprot:364451-Chlamydomonas_euryale.AAC.1